MIYYEIICIFRPSFQDTVAPKILCLLENALRYVLKNDRKDECHLGVEDKYFPVGHTCGFSIELPNYSTKEIMLEKILKAITLCGEIDDDGAYYGDGGEGEGEHDSESSSSE